MTVFQKAIGRMMTGARAQQPQRQPPIDANLMPAAFGSATRLTAKHSSNAPVATESLFQTPGAISLKRPKQRQMMIGQAGGHRLTKSQRRRQHPGIEERTCSAKRWHQPP